MNSFVKGYDWEGKFYTGNLKPTVPCDSMNYAASYWSFVPHYPNLYPGEGGRPPRPPDHATDLQFKIEFRSA